MDSNDDISRGTRVFEVRKALGPSPRRPLSQDAFAERLTAVGQGRYYGPEISLMEQGKKPLTLTDIAVIASVDPQQRGREWLAWGPENAPANGLPEVHSYTPEELQEAATQAEKDRADRAAETGHRRKPKAGGER